MVNYIQEEARRKTIAIDFIVVGPIAQEAKKGSGMFDMNTKVYLATRNSMYVCKQSIN